MLSALMLLAGSSLAVMFGWQPMPDGSPQYEYVVQIEPELLATMKEGTTIPISSEVPEEIRPIARIRIMVGSGELPRQSLPAHRSAAAKPWPAQETRAGLVETQYNVPTTDRYNNQQILPADNRMGQVLPPSSPPLANDGDFGQTLQRSAEAARNTASAGDILPPDSQIRPAQTAPRYAQPIESASPQSGNQADISRLFGPEPTARQGQVQPVDQRTSSDRYATSPSPDQSILPPARATGASSADDWRANETPSTTNRIQRLDEPITASTPTNQRTGATPPSAPGVFNAPWPPLERFADAPLAQEWNNRTAADSRSATQPVTSGSNGSDWPNVRTTSGTNSLEVADRSTAGGGRPLGDSLSFPPATNSQPSGDHIQSPSPAPEIRREMLREPADAALVTASGEPVRPTAASFPPNVPPPPAPQHQFPSAPTANPVDLPAAGQPAPTATAAANTGASKTLPLLLSWVLLSGSGAGNLYLFWSYLDIRQKYRDLVRTARRKLGRGVRDDLDEEEYED